MRNLASLFARSAILTAGCVLVGVLFNALRPNGIELIASREYEIYVPCPESETEAAEVTAAKTKANKSVLYVDARPPTEYKTLHIKGAMSFPYPVLGDPDPELLSQLKRSGAPIVTYGGGGLDKLGEMMAKLLKEEGIDDVTHLKGGLPEWQKQGGEVEGGENE